MQVAKKVILLSFVFSLVNVSSAQAIRITPPKCPTVAAGDNIKISGQATIYYINDKLEYRYYPDMNVYKSWNLNSAAFKIISKECFGTLRAPSAFPLAITMRPGYLPVRREKTNTLFVVLPGNTLAPVSSSTLHELYGPSTTIAVITDREWSNYLTTTLQAKEGKVHPGMLIIGNKKYYWINQQGVQQEISAKGLVANKLSTSLFKTVPKTSLEGIRTGTRIDTAVPALTDVTQLSVKTSPSTIVPPPTPIPSTTSQGVPTVKSRDVIFQPFSNDSPWNTPLAVTAQFGGTTDLCTKDLVDSAILATVNARERSHPVYIGKESDPMVEIYSNTVDLKTAKPLAVIHIPKNAIPALPDFAKNPDSDAHLHIIDPIKKEVHEMWRAKWIASNKMTVWTYHKNSLTGIGVESGGARAYGGSAIGGLIRKGELKTGIAHSVAFAVPRAKQRLKNAPVWPATTVDDFAGKDYRGNIPMGQLVAIPTSTDLSRINLSPQGKILAEALKNFGAYNVDSSGDMALYVEPAAAGEMGELEEDWKKLRPYLKCVLNNHKDTVGGGDKKAKRFTNFPLL